jgi:hypothetical protein
MKFREPRNFTGNRGYGAPMFVDRQGLCSSSSHPPSLAAESQVPTCLGTHNLITKVPQLNYLKPLAKCTISGDALQLAADRIKIARLANATRWTCLKSVTFYTQSIGNQGATAQGRR